MRCNTQYQLDDTRQTAACTRPAGHKGSHASFYRCSICERTFEPEQLENMREVNIKVARGFVYFMQPIGRDEIAHYIRVPGGRANMTDPESGEVVTNAK
jgi:hypothetical protein